MTSDGEGWTCTDCGIALPDGATPCPACAAKSKAPDRSAPAGGAAEAKAGVYMARGAKNPLANAAFLAVQALTHPNRTLVLDTGETAGDRFPRWLAVPRDQAPWPASVPDIRQAVGRVLDSDASAGGGVGRAKAPSPGAAPTLTPAFNYALIIVVVFTAAAFAVEIAMGFALGEHLTDAQKTLSATADWILKSGIGAFLGLLGAKSIK
jgi:hypothetical protein